MRLEKVGSLYPIASPELKNNCKWVLSTVVIRIPVKGKILLVKLMKYITQASIHDNHGSTEVLFGSGLEGITKGIEDDGDERNLTHSGKFRLESRYHLCITTFSHRLAKK